MQFADCVQRLVDIFQLLDIAFLHVDAERDVIDLEFQLDVEINGALAIRKEFEGKANLTFVPILPSSDELWEQILRERSAKDGCRPADVEARIKNAPMEKARMKAEFPEADFVENDYDKLFYNRIVNRVLQGLPSYVTI